LTAASGGSSLAAEFPSTNISFTAASNASARRALAPIVLSAVIVFIASSIMYMVLPYHKSDYKKLPDEDKLLGVLRGAGVR